MISYLVGHWRGRYHVAWALLVNGLLGCIVVILAWEIVSHSTPLNWSQQVFGPAVFWAWFLWAAVDIEAPGALRRPCRVLRVGYAVLAKHRGAL